jgi:endonuclease III
MVNIINIKTIGDRLIERGQSLFHAPKKFIEFTQIHEANALLNDLDLHPHAFVLACVMDRQIKAEKAWIIPFKISEKLGSFSMSLLRQLSREEVQKLMTQPEPLHRFVDNMSEIYF